MDLYKIILKPVTTEKSAVIAGENKYTFLVNQKANKIEVANAIEAIYGYKPVKVNIISTKEKHTGRGRLKRKQHKKAIVTLKDKDKLDVTKIK